MKLREVVLEIFAVVKELAASSPVRTAALLLFPYAGILVGLDVAARYGELTGADLPRQFFLSYDRGFGEWLEYSLTAAVAVLLYLMWQRDRVLVYLANAVLFVWLTLDNALEFHERFGDAVEQVLPFSNTPFAVHDIGEAGLLVAIGGFWLLALWHSLRTARLRASAYAIMLAGCIAAAAMFGIVIDLLTAWDGEATALLEIETFIEDAGEFAMIGLAFLLTVGFYELEKAARRTRPGPSPIPEPLPTT